ncbi:MAG: hypothetical protein C0623_00195 [Desulfuromonas sp.]|nr:MAG: hypothetical protein C0623_00195 [Desulfuromonas sp.]
MKRILKWFISGPVLRGLLLVVIVAGSLFECPPFTKIDHLLFDQIIRLRSGTDVDRVAVVAIDESSLETVGSWPWPRTYLAESLQRISAQNPAAIGVHLLLEEEEWNPGLAGLRSLKRQLKSNRIKGPLSLELAEIESSIDGNGQLTKALQSPPVKVLPYTFAAGELAPDPSEALPPHLKSTHPDPDWQASLSALHNPLRRQDSPAELIPGFGSFGNDGTLLGHVFYQSDLNGRARAVSLLKKYRGKLFPALVLQLAGAADRRKNPYLKVDTQVLYLNNQAVTTGEDYSVYVNPVTESAVPRHSIVDVVNGVLPDDALADKIVLLGLTTSARTTGGVVPVPQPAPVVSAAAVISDLLSGQQIIRPFWGFLLELSVLIYLGVFMILVLPRLHFGLGLLLQASFLVSWIGVVTGLLMLKGLWFQMAPHLMVFVFGMLLIAMQRYLGGTARNFEDLKMLGLSFQSQGMLDIAFDKFRDIPVKDQSIREILYNLGLDFERKRMFNKAIAVYKHLLRGGKFKDAKKKIEELNNMEQSVVFGGNGKRDGTMVLGKGSTAPTLGRYEVVRELGQGAMGTVYLGRDPKINREVAIKTLNLQEVEPAELKEFKERFFREAEAAGRLNHPNIVTIYDAGEEHDLAYMAMEYLEGEDLTAHCNIKKLLEPKKVMQLAVEIAEALAYAHKNDIYHRDIKPSNLMLLKNGQIKVTDFGIARIKNSTQTQTGTILGTPSYMSPEQVSGKKIEGASDLFSLGVVCYELLCGEKPFSGDSLGALMHNIANVKYTPLKRVRSDLPECCYAVVRKLLKKDVRDRYKNATEVADALKKCIDKTG